MNVQQGNPRASSRQHDVFLACTACLNTAKRKTPCKKVHTYTSFEFFLNRRFLWFIFSRWANQTSLLEHAKKPSAWKRFQAASPRHAQHRSFHCGTKHVKLDDDISDDKLFQLMQLKVREELKSERWKWELLLEENTQNAKARLIEQWTDEKDLERKRNCTDSQGQCIFPKVMSEWKKRQWTSNHYDRSFGGTRKRKINSCCCTSHTLTSN